MTGKSIPNLKASEMPRTYVGFGFEHGMVFCFSFYLGGFATPLDPSLDHAYA